MASGGYDISGSTSTSQFGQSGPVQFGAFNFGAGSTSSQSQSNGSEMLMYIGLAVVGLIAIVFFLKR